MNKKNQKKETKNKTRSQKNKKIAAFLVVAIIFSIFATYGLIRLNYILKDEIVINLEGHVKSFNAYNKQTINPEIKIEVLNQPICTATCKETIQDLSTSEIIFSNEFEFNKKTTKETNINYQINEFGSGTKVLSYKIECKNQVSRGCPAKEDPFIGRMALLIEYNPADKEIEIIQNYREYLEKTSKNLKYSEAYENETKETLKEIKKTNTFDTLYKVEELNKNLEIINEKQNQSSKIINNKNYDSIIKFLRESTLAKESENLLENYSEIYKTLNTSIERHKIVANKINEALNEIKIINSAHNFIPKAAPTTEIESTKNIENVKIINNEINTIILIIENKFFDNYNFVEQKSEQISILIEQEVNHTLNNYQKTGTKNIIINLAENMLCVTEEDKICNSDSVEIISEKTKINFETKENIINQSEIECAEAKDALNKINLFQNQNNISDENSVVIERKKILVSFLKKENILLNENKISEITLKYFIDELMMNISENYFNITDINENYYPLEYNKSLVSQMKPDEESVVNKLKEIITLCETKPINPSISLIEFDNITMNENFLDNVIYDIIPEIKPECCIYGECSECGIKPIRNPVILLHGHSFSSSTTAFTSADIFGQFEEKLFTENLYLPLGYVRSFQHSDSYKNLAQLRVPISLRPTYYTETYFDSLNTATEEQKGGGIDTYAIRLKDIIENTKKVTGSEQVTIIAHSMGGLVTRRYLQIFGEESVDKLIMIGTPNQGIDTPIERLCRLLGQRAECGEMAENSLFIKKLNSDKMPEKTEMYLIIGYGCDGAEEEWDGIVLKRNAELEGVETYYYNGTCEGTNIFHNRMLRPNIHPEIYEKVKEILMK